MHNVYWRPSKKPHACPQGVGAPSRNGLLRNGHGWRERFSKRQQHHARLQRLDRSGQPRQYSGSNVFLAGECLGIVGAILYFSRDFPFSSAACPPANVTYNQAIQIVTAYINARPQRIQERFVDLATEALHDAWPCKPNLK